MKNLPNNPIFVTGDPEEVAQERKDQLLNLHLRAALKGRPDTPVSEAYAEEARQQFLARAVRVSSPYEANAILCGRKEA